ncbi:MAG: type IV pilus secretin PilQ [Pseudomonadota bacterium]
MNREVLGVCAMGRWLKPPNAAMWLSAITLLVALLLGSTGPALAQNEFSNYLDDIEVITLPGQQVQLVLRMRGAAPEPNTFSIDNPARISIDLADTGVALATRRRDVGIGLLNSVVAAEAAGRTRVVLNLDSPVTYTAAAQGNTVTITLASEAEMAASSTAPLGSGGINAPSPASRTGTFGSSELRNVDFRRSEEGAGRVVLQLSDPSTVVDLQQEGDQVIVVLKNTTVPSELMQRLDVLDFATPVKTIDTMQVNRDTRVIVTGFGAFDQLAYQSDERVTVELKPLTPEELRIREEEERERYTGERLTLNFQDIEARAVLQLLADVSNQNIVVSDTVAGNVTLRLQNVPWDQALDIVLQTKGLDKRQKDNVILVAPAEEIANRERRELEAASQIRQLAPLRSEFIQVNYAKAQDLALLIQGAALQGVAGGVPGGGARRTLLSERGSVTLDERTNTLLVQDTAEKLAEIRRLVRTLDVPVRQVLIESRIVIVNDDFSRDIGIRSGITAVEENGSDGLIAITGGSAGADTIVNSGLNNLNTTGSPFPAAVPALNDRLNVNVPIASPAGRLGLAILDSNYLLDLELAALQAEGRGEIISTPRVITANQQEATIKQGVEIPFQEASASGATTTRFKEAVLSLVVVPLITPDNRIIMDLQVSQDSIGEQVPSATGGFVPSIDTREVVTQVLVNNGETVVLGGIYETTKTETLSKVPVLGDIPGLGRLFQSSTRSSNKAELLIFVTPKILREGSNVF